MRVKTNVTIRIDEHLAREAKILAASRGTSLSRLIAEELALLVSKDANYQRAARQAIKDIRESPPLGYEPVARDELHER